MLLWLGRAATLLAAFLFAAPAAAWGPSTETGNTTGYINPNGILLLVKDNSAPAGVVVTYSNCASMLTDVVGFGSASDEYLACLDFYAAGGQGTVSVWRMANGDARARLYGGGLTTASTCTGYNSITAGNLTFTMNSYAYTAGTNGLNLGSVTTCTNLASTIQSDINANLAAVSTLSSSSSLAPENACFTASIDNWVMAVTAMAPNVSPCTGTSAAIQPGSFTSCPDWPNGACKVVAQLDTNGPNGTTGATGGVGHYIIYYTSGSPQNVASGPMVATWALLTVGTVSSGTVGLGALTGSGVAGQTAIMSNISGSGAGSTWVVNNSQTITATALTNTAPTVTVTFNNPPGSGGVETLWIQPNNTETLEPSTSISVAGGSSAAALFLTTVTGAKLGIPSQDPIDTTASLNEAISQYSTFANVQWIGDIPPVNIAAATAAWATANGVAYLSPVVSP